MGRTTRRERGTGELTRLANGRWRAVLVYHDDPTPGRKRRVSATADTRTRALETARRRLDKLRDDTPAPDHMPTVGQWCDQWVDTTIKPRRTPSTWLTYRQRIRCAIKPILGDLPLDRLRPSHARLLENSILNGSPRHHINPGSPATARLTLTILRNALADAMRDGIIDRNPFDRLGPTPLDTRRATPLTPDQATTLISMEPDPTWRLIWRLMFATGMRVGEIIAITPRAISSDRDTPILIVDWQLKRLPVDETDIPHWYERRRLTRSMWMVRPKTRSGRRVIPLPDGLAHDLTGLAKGREPDDLLFTSRRGNPLCRETVREHWKQALDRAGLPAVNVHSARHTTATMLARAGVPDLIRKAIIGHSRIDTTDSVYTHLDPGMLARAISPVTGTFDDTSR